MENKLLKVRKEIKRRKPNFVRADIHKNKGLDRKWRRPDGFQNKVRLCWRGKLRRVEIGFGSPKEVKGLSREGLIFSSVSNVSDLSGLSKDKHIVVIKSTVGNRKRLLILEEAKKSNLKVYNYVHADKKIESIKKDLENSKVNSQNVKKRVEERIKKASKKEGKEHNKEQKEAKEHENKEIKHVHNDSHSHVENSETKKEHKNNDEEHAHAEKKKTVVKKQSSNNN